MLIYSIFLNVCLKNNFGCICVLLFPCEIFCTSTIVQMGNCILFMRQLFLNDMMH